MLIKKRLAPQALTGALDLAATEGWPRIMDRHGEIEHWERITFSDRCLEPKPNPQWSTQEILSSKWHVVLGLFSMTDSWIVTVFNRRLKNSWCSRKGDARFERPNQSIHAGAFVTAAGGLIQYRVNPLNLLTFFSLSDENSWWRIRCMRSFACTFPLSGVTVLMLTGELLDSFWRFNQLLITL